MLPLDKIIYTGKATKEEIIQELNKLISKFLHELYDEETPGVDNCYSTPGVFLYGSIMVITIRHCSS